MRKTLSIIAGVALCASFAAPQFAHANLLTNGGLEVTAGQLAADPTLLSPYNIIYVSPSVHSNALTGWTVGGASVDIVPSSYWQSAEGSYSVDLIGTPGLGSISQTVTGLTPGTAYVLTFDFAINPETIAGEGNSTKILQVTASNTDLAPTLFTGTAGTATKLNMDWTTEALVFTPIASTVTLQLAALMPSGLPESFTPSTVFCGPVVDNLDLEPFGGGSPNTPEPASASLLAIGALALLRRRGRHT